MTRYHTLSLIKIAAIVIFVGGLIAYSLFNSRIFISGPQITITSPQNGASIEENRLVEVSGEATHISYLSLNDRQIYTDENGFFEEDLLLNVGYNVIQLKAKDKFNRSIERTIEVVYTGEIIEINQVQDQEESETATSSEIE